MDYRILRDGFEVAQVQGWPEKFHSDGKLTASFVEYFCAWVVAYEPATFPFHKWEAVEQ